MYEDSRSACVAFRERKHDPVQPDPGDVYPGQSVWVRARQLRPAAYPTVPGLREHLSSKETTHPPSARRRSLFLARTACDGNKTLREPGPLHHPGGSRAKQPETSLARAQVLLVENVGHGPWVFPMGTQPHDDASWPGRSTLARVPLRAMNRACATRYLISVSNASRVDAVMRLHSSSTCWRSHPC